MGRSVKALIAVAVLLVIFSGSAAANQLSVNKVDIHYDGEVYSFNTKAATVSEVLMSKDIVLTADDSVNYDMDKEIESQMEIIVTRSFFVTLNTNGVPKRIKTTKKTVGEVVKDEISNNDGKTIIESHAPSDAIEPEMEITVSTEHVIIASNSEIIPYDTVKTETEDLLVGEERIAQTGVVGKKTITNELTYRGTKLISNNTLKEEIVAEPVSQIIEYGTKVENTVPLSDYNLTPVSGNLIYSDAYVMEATAYTVDRGDSGPITATGERCRVGLVAVDPKVIPIGTLLYIEGYGEARAADTGGAIKGKKIDLYFDTYNECVNFGRRKINVYVLQ